MKARIIRRHGNPSFAAIGVKTVAIDHQTTPKPSTSFPPSLSAHMPPTIYTKKKAFNQYESNVIRIFHARRTK